MDAGCMHQLETLELSVYHVPVGTKLWVISDLLTGMGEPYGGISTIQWYFRQLFQLLL
jgi:hypothetical protein